MDDVDQKEILDTKGDLYGQFCSVIAIGLAEFYFILFYNFVLCVCVCVGGGGGGGLNYRKSAS